MFHQILPKIDLAHMVDKFEKGVFDLVLKDQRQREVVVEWLNAKNCKNGQSEIVDHDIKFPFWMNLAIDQR
jgi:hypothetical protein